MSYIFLAIGVGIGLLFFLIPVIVPERFMPIQLRERVSNFLFDVACRYFSRIVFLTRKHGSVEMYSSSYDNSKLAEKVVLGKDEEAFFEDPYNGCVHALFNRECMFADERVSFIYNPMLATIAEETDKFHRTGGHKKTFTNKHGEEVNAYCGHIFIPDTPSFCNLRSITSILPASADPLLASTTRFFIEMSQSEYKNFPLLQMALGITFFLAGFLTGAVAIWLLDESPLPPALTDAIPLMIGAIL